MNKILKLFSALLILSTIESQAIANPLDDAAKKYEKYGVQGIRLKPGILKKLMKNEKIDESDLDYSIIYNSSLGSVSVDINYEDLVNTD